MLTDQAIWKSTNDANQNQQRTTIRTFQFVSLFSKSTRKTNTQRKYFLWKANCFFVVCFRYLVAQFPVLPVADFMRSQKGVKLSRASCWWTGCINGECETVRPKWGFIPLVDCKTADVSEMRTAVQHYTSFSISKFIKHKPQTTHEMLNMFSDCNVIAVWVTCNRSIQNKSLNIGNLHDSYFSCKTSIRCKKGISCTLPWQPRIERFWFSLNFTCSLCSPTAGILKALAYCVFFTFSLVLVDQEV